MVFFSYALLIEYDGTPFHGWQSQKHKKTIQDHLQNALFQIFHQPIAVKGASRTDAGVHAKGQVASVHLPKEVEPHTLLQGLNALTPREIRVRAVEKKQNDFCPRKMNVGKTYHYALVLASSPPALLHNRVWHLPYPLDVEKMKQASQNFIGQHDFSAFRQRACQNPNPNRKIYSFGIQQTKQEEEIFLTFQIHGDGFLKNMVRILVGTLVDVGMGKITEEKIVAAYENKDRTTLGRTAPACGLFLQKIHYPFPLFGGEEKQNQISIQPQTAIS